MGKACKLYPFLLIKNQMALKDTAKRLKMITVEQQLKKLREIIEDTSEVVFDLNKGQLMQGIDSNGLSLGEYSNEAYARMKRTLNPNGVVDLKLTGSFHENFFLVSEIPLIIWSYDEKTNKLVEDWGKDLFGLTKESKKVYLIGHIRPRFQEVQKELLQL